MKIIPLSLAAALLCSALYAEDTVELGDITVTATKSAVATFEAPASVSVVTSEDIEEQSIQRADQALKDLPGVYVRALGDNRPSNFSNTVTLRGIPGYYRTAVQVDGFALNDAFSGAVNWSSIPVEEIERIEVVSGPFSSLYGGNAMGGVINVITRKPEKREVSIVAGMGSNGYYKGGISYRDRFKDLGVSLHYDRQESDGYASDYVVKSASAGAGTIPVSGWVKTTDVYGDTVYILGDKGDRSWWSDNADLKLTYDIDDDSKINFGLSYHAYETDYDYFNSYLRDASGNVIYSGNIEINDGIAYNKTISEKDFLFGPNGQEITTATLGYETDVTSEVTAKLNASYSEYAYWYVSQSTGATVNGGAGTYTDIPSDRTFASAQLEFPIGDRQFLVAGVDINRNELEKRTSTMYDWHQNGVLDTLTYRSNGQSTTQAFFIQDEIALADAWNVYLGGRYDYWETSGVVEGFGTSPYVLTYPERDTSHFSPKVSVVYLPTQKTTLRASVGKAFRAPTLSDLYSSWLSSGGKLSQANPNLKPEKTTSWEIGLEQKFDTGTLLRTTYYENYLKDLIYTTDVSTLLSEKRNAGRAEIKGIEIGITQKLFDGVEVFANYTYNDAIIVENASVPASVGKRVTYTPQKQANVGVTLREGKWNGSVTGNYVDEITTKDDNTDRYKNVYGGYESYVTVDAKIGYELVEGLKASFSVTNLFDETYYQYYMTPGRTLYGELSYRF